MSNLKELWKQTVRSLINPVEYFEPQFGLEIEPYIEKEHRQGIHHLARYHWARQVLQDHHPGTVLDIACGAGYGSYLLASSLPQTQITGSDYDYRAVNAAQKIYALPNLKYIHGNLMTWETETNHIVQPLGEYAAIVSFDTLEHVEHREIALIRLTQNLAQDGIFLLSTPCGHETTQLTPDLIHHKIEYGYRDLQNVLRRFFRTVLLPEDSTLPHLEYWTQVVNKGKIRYNNLTNPVYCANPIK